MPGPCNQKKRYKQSRKKQQCSKPRASTESVELSVSPDSSYSPSPRPTPSPLPKSELEPETRRNGLQEDNSHFEGLILDSPCISNPGNGIRVRDTHAFLSSFFAQPPALNDPLCAEFSQEEVLQMLRSVLPEELALILWYNKSRSTGRVCPACRRLYKLGDTLPDHLDEEDAPNESRPPLPQLEREQEISGLCSPVCFILSSWAYPGAITSTWGRAANEIDDNTWALLNIPVNSITGGDLGLCMLLKMTRLDDLGLGQLLCLPDDTVQKPASAIYQRF